MLAIAGWLLRSTRLGVGLDDTAQFVVGILAWLTCREAARSPYAVPRAWTLAGRAALAWAIGEAILSFQHLVLNSTARPSPGDIAFAVAAVYALRAPLAFPAALTRLSTRSRVLLEGAVIASSALFIVWMEVLIPYVTPGLSHGRLALELAYPLLDIVIISMVLATLARAPHQHALSLGAAALGLTALAGTNLAEACLGVARDSTPLVSLWDVGFVIGLSLVATGIAVGGLGAPSRLVERIVSLQNFVPYLPTPAMLFVIWTHRRAVPDGPMVLLFVFGALMVARQLALAAENSTLFEDHQRAMDAVAQSEQRYRRIVENAAEGMVLVDSDGITRFVNSRAAEMCGLAVDDMLGRPIRDVLHDLLDDNGREVVRQRMADRKAGRSSTYEFSLRRADGTKVQTLISASPLFDSRGEFEGSLTMISDITARKQLEDQLVEQARTDALTGLGNRALLNAVSQSTLSRAGAALVYCDLDGFKAVNDSLGHAAGDLLLRGVAKR